MSQQTHSAKSPEDLFNEAVTLQEQGQLNEAISLYNELLNEFSTVGLLHLNIGLAYSDLNQHQTAHDHFYKAAELEPENPSVLFSLAYSYKNLGKAEQAAAIYETLLKSDSKQPEVLYNLANCYKDLGSNTLAIDTYRKVLELAPEHRAAINNLAFILHKDNRIDDAIACYTKLLEIDSENISARYLLAALSQNTDIECPPDAYIQEVFDSYSGHYDKSLVEELEYCVPEKIQAALLSCNIPFTFATVLDLGCGSGLAAETFARAGICFTGVDLSSKMLQLAADKQLYQELYCSPIDDFLAQNTKRFDLILAADVFAYFGSLEQTFTGAITAAQQDTIFAFSAEVNDRENFSVRQSGRFAHSVSYIEDTLTAAGWQAVYKEITGIRKERGEWIKGVIFVAIPTE